MPIYDPDSSKLDDRLSVEIAVRLVIDHWRHLTALGSSAGNWREVAAIVLAIFYGSGLIQWQLFAWRNGFGYVAGLNVQYLVAGFVMGLFAIFLGLLVLIFSAILYWLSRLTELRLERKEDYLSHRFHKNIKWLHNAFRVVIGMGLCVSLALAFKAIITIKDEWFVGCLAIPFLIGWGIVFSTVCQDGTHESVRNWTRRTARSSKWFVFTSILAIACYHLYLYPEIPQELGGGKPKVCYIDIEIDKMSDRMICELVNDEDLEGSTPLQEYESCRGKVALLLGLTKDETHKNPEISQRLKVLHSKELDLWFNSNECIIVRAPTTVKRGENLKATTFKVVRIPSNLFSAITIHRQSYEENVESAKRLRDRQN